MTCRICSSDNQAEFAAEMVIHFSGLKNLDNPASGIPEAFGLLGLRIFSVYRPGNQIAASRKRPSGT